MKQGTVLKNVYTLYGKTDKIPEKWEFLTLDSLTPIGDKTSIKMGPFGSDLKKHELLNEGEIKTLWIENIVDNKLNLNYKKFITKEKYQELKNFTVKENDVVLSMMGTVGRVAIIPKDIGTAIITSHLLKITLEQKKCLPVFLQYYFLSDFAKNQLNRESRGIVMQGLNTGIVKCLKIALPSLKEQQKIVSILSNVDELIQKTEQIIEQTQILKKGLMQRLLTKGIGHTKFKKTELGEIPEEWNLCSLIEFVDGKNDIVAGPFGSNLKVIDYKIKGVPIIRLQNIERNRFINENIRYISPDKAEELKYHSYRQNDIVLAKLGDPIGKTCIIPQHIKSGIVVADVVRIRPSIKKSDTKFLEYALNSDFCLKQMNGGSIGTTRPRVNLDQIRYLKLFKPPIKEQQKIASILSNIDLSIQWLQENKSKIQHLKKGLMQQLLTGKIRVKV